MNGPNRWVLAAIAAAAFIAVPGPVRAAGSSPVEREDARELREAREKEAEERAAAAQRELAAAEERARQEQQRRDEEAARVAEAQAAPAGPMCVDDPEHRRAEEAELLLQQEEQRVRDEAAKKQRALEARAAAARARREREARREEARRRAERQRELDAAREQGRAEGRAEAQAESEAQAASEPASQAASEPASQDASEPASQAASEPDVRASPPSSTCPCPTCQEERPADWMDAWFQQQGCLGQRPDAYRPARRPGWDQPVQMPAFVLDDSGNLVFVIMVVAPQEAASSVLSWATQLFGGAPARPAPIPCEPCVTAAGPACAAEPQTTNAPEQTPVPAALDSMIRLVVR